MKFKMRRVAASICMVIFMFCGAFVLERSPFFSPLKQALRTDKIPPAMVNYGAFGKVVTRLGLFTPVPNDTTRYAPTEPVQSQDATAIFQKKRVVGDWLFTPRNRWAHELPSSKMVSGMPIIRSCPVISIAVNEEDLTGPDGIFTHPEKRGRKSERLASVSYFENGKMMFETYTGIRLHGGTSRKMKNSFRIYFRKEYGMNRVDPGLLFEDGSHAIKRLVVRYDAPVDEPFTTCLAFDITEKLGCNVPANRPAFCYLNGKYKGFYYLSEHLGRKQWEEHTGHRRFDFFRFRSKTDPVSKANYDEFVKVFSEKKDKFTADFAIRYFDVDNLTSNMMAITFCGTTDGMQGVVFRDRKAEAPRWSWINWDLDHSFRDKNKKKDDQRSPWEQEGMELAFPSKAYNYRSVKLSLFYKLIMEDPEYRKLFLEKYVFALNHILTEDYFRERIKYYQRMADRAGLNGKVLIKPKKDFLTHRPQFIREQLQQIFNLSPFSRYEVRGPENVQYIIDGHREKNGYVGYYSDKTPMRIEVAPGYPKIFSHWLVNGSPYNSGDSEEGTDVKIYVPGREANITPVFKN